jgi:hypothetical protein
MPADDDNALAIMRLAWRVDALEEWRKHIGERVALNSRELERLVKADEIADEVSKRLNSQQSFRLTTVQKRVAILAAAAAGLSTLAGLGIQLAHLIN